MSYYLIDPTETQQLWPISRTRPVAEILLGILTIRQKWEKYLGAAGSHICKPPLSLHYNENTGPSEHIFIAGNLLPDDILTSKIRELKVGQGLHAKGRLLAAHLPSFDRESEFHLNMPGISTMLECDSAVFLDQLWQIFQFTDRELRKDFNLLTSGNKSASLSSTNTILGEQLYCAENVNAECAMINTRTGPVFLDSGVEIMEGAMLRGPIYLGKNSQVKLGAKIYGASSFGPECRLGGEINNSVVLGYSNKGHDGFLGNAVVGEWCNIGADSNNSNLKNNYEEVKIWSYVQEKFVRTGSQFCGLIMGDHAKCGINTMFNTGTVVGVGASVFGEGFPRQFIPDFAWGGASGFSTFQAAKFFVTAENMMSRRHKSLAETEREILELIFRETEKYRSWERIA